MITTTNYKTIMAIDNAIFDIITVDTKPDTFDPIHNIEDYEALDKYVLNHDIKRPSYGREIWQAISSVTSSIREALEYWNLCWFKNGEGVYRFWFPTFSGEESYEEIPAPTEENFLSYVWEA